MTVRSPPSIHATYLSQSPIRHEKKPEWPRLVAVWRMYHHGKDPFLPFDVYLIYLLFRNNQTWLLVNAADAGWLYFCVYPFFTFKH